MLDGLFYIATSDGVVTAEELTYLARVSELFGQSPLTFRRIRATHLGPEADDPYETENKWNGESIRRQRRFAQRFCAFKSVHQSLRSQDQAKSTDGSQNQAMGFAAEQGLAHETKAGPLEWSTQN